MSVWGKGGRFEQYRFGRRKLLVRGGAKRPLPRWAGIEEEKLKQAIARRYGDAMKEMLFKEFPGVRIWSVYGAALINGRKQKFSFDVAYSKRDYPDGSKKMYVFKKEIYERLYRGEIPRRYYYQFFISPWHLQHTRWTTHEGIGEIGQISKGKGDRGKFESWRPMGRTIKSERKVAREIATKLRARERYERIKRTMRYE